MKKSLRKFKHFLFVKGTKPAQPALKQAFKLSL